MTQWSIPIQAGWKLRVTTGSSIGQELPLAQGRHVLGSKTPATIVVPDPSIAPQHVVLEVHSDHVMLTDQSGQGVMVNGVSKNHARIESGDDIKIGVFGFQIVNPAATRSSVPAGASHWTMMICARCLQSIHRIQAHWRVAVISGLLAATLFLLMLLTENVHLVPITLIAMSGVVPATVMTYLVSRYDKTGISFRTLTLTFVLGGTIGIVVTVLTGQMASFIVGGVILIPMFAGVFEEPAKLFATFWRWHHPAYDRPIDGLIIGTVSGFGFAVFETAGYSLRALLEGGIDELLWVTIVRGATSPFGHGLWTGILAAAFWQCGRRMSKAIMDRRFQITLVAVVGLHAIWNLSAIFLELGLIFLCISGYLTYRLYRRRLTNKGYIK